MTSGQRTALVAPERIEGWIARFAKGHGQPGLAVPGAEEADLTASGEDLGIEDTDAGIRLTAADGAVALLVSPWPSDGRPGRGATAVERLVSLAGQNRTAAVILLRRGGYAIGLCQGGDVLISKTGTRYVQSRTAAGGWSQQRFARRRANQADALVEAVAQHAARLLAPGQQSRGVDARPDGGVVAGVVAGSAPGVAPASAATAEYLVLGGDKALCQSLLAEPAFGPLATLPRLPFLDVPDPRSAVLRQAARDLRSIRIRVTDR